MAIYIVNLTLVVALGTIYSCTLSIDNKNRISGKRIYMFLVFFFWSFTMAMRSTEVGADTAMYARIYQMIGQSNSLGKAINNAPLTAPVYVCFCWILSHISCQPQMLILASSFFITIGLFVFIRKTSSNIVISSICWIGLTMLYASMNGHRQFMSIVMVLNAYYYLSENLADKKGWILMLAATGIHISAIFSVVALIGVALANKIGRAVV